MQCDCGFEKIVERSIKIGPPKRMKCPECKSKMYQDLTGQGVIFKGWFPGEEIKKNSSSSSYNSSKRKEIEEQSHKDKQSAVDEVTEARRKGKKHSLEYRKKNPKTWKTASEAMKEGYVSKKKIDKDKFNKDLIQNAKKKLRKKDD
jgi:predicted nucleic acid-binding Zn ribbon protein